VRSLYPTIDVLFVDEDIPFLETCREHLELSGHMSVDIASSAEEAIQAASANQYGVIVSSYSFRGMGGVELLRWLRGQGSVAPFILYAPMGNEDVAIEALNAGAAGYVQKCDCAERFLAQMEKAVRVNASRYRGERLLNGLNDIRGRLNDVGSLDSKLKLISDEAIQLLEAGTVRIWMLRPGDLCDRGCQFAAPDAAYPCRDRTSCLHLVSISCSDPIADWNLDRVPSKMFAGGGLTTGEVSRLISDDVARDPRLSEYAWPEEPRIWLAAYRIEDRDGGVMGAIVLTRTSPIHEPEERLLAGLAETASPIMYRGLAEQALTDSEERLRAVFNGVSDAIIICSLDGYILELNEVASRITGYSRKDLLGKGLETIAPNYPRETIIRWLEEADENPKIMENVQFNRDGKRLIVESLFRSIRYSGQPSVLILMRDITRRKMLELELEESRRKLLDGMDLAHMVHWDYDAVADRYTFDERFYALYGTDSGREGGYHMSHQEYVEAFILPEDRERANREIGASLEGDGGEVVQIEHRIRRRDGEVRHMIVRTSMVRDLDGRAVRSYGVNQDVTELKVAEGRLREANDKLRLLSSVTGHDLRNQLTILQGNIGLAQSLDQGPEMMERLSRMENAVLSIDSHLKFAQDYQEMGASSPSWQDVVLLVERLAVSKEMDHLDIGTLSGLHIFADPILPKVFHNLMEDTMKYGASPAWARMSAIEVNGSLRLIYEDRGPGILVEDKERIFERGYGRGLGFGLFLCREILGITGITIAETGMPGQGARFEITIPPGHFRWERPGGSPWDRKSA
jgi:PAS domain S-box-containing protein